MSHLVQGFRLSPQQRRLWEQGGGSASSPYRALLRLRLDGDFAPDELRRALERVVERYEILRTAYRSLPGVLLPLQVVNPTGSVAWESHGLADLAPERRQERRAELLGHLAEEPLGLQAGSGLRALFLRLGEREAELAISLPSLAADTRTLDLLATALRDALAGTGPEAEEIQYADLAGWQNELLEAPEAEAGRSFWNALDLSPLAGTRLPEEVRGGAAFAPRELAVALPPSAVARWAGLAGELAAEPADVLFAAWAALLARLTGETRIVLGHVHDGRPYAELEQAPGPFAKVLPVGLEVSCDRSLAELVPGLQPALAEAVSWLEAYCWQGLGEAVPFLPYVFEAEEPSGGRAAGALLLDIEERSAVVDRFTARLRWNGSLENTRLSLGFDAGRLAPAAAERLAGYVRTFLAAALERPLAAVESLPVLPAAQRRLVIAEPNRTGRPFPEDLLLHELVEEQVARRGEADAVVVGEERLSYRELGERSGRLAGHLRGLGIGPEARVGISVERSTDLVTAILGVLRAGGAYVPLDPGYPAERLHQMGDDAGIPVAVASPAARPLFSERGVLVVPPRSEQPAGPALAAPRPEPAGAAYVIYTSGSTGRPKGVVVSHRNAVHSTVARFHVYREPVESFLLLSSFSFDSSVAGIFWTLAQGGRLVLPEEGRERDVSRLVELVERHRVSHLLALPALWELILAEGGPHRLASLKTVVVAGESCPPGLVRRHCEFLPQMPLFNEYGPTEASVWSSVARLDDEAPPYAARVAIGAPPPNVRLYLVDRFLEPVPLDVPGEVYVAGEGLARGYLGRPAATAERFLPDPFTEVAGGRLYRTGDLARRRPGTGELEILGRVDHQVKIRGYRIEPGEIEAYLKRLPGLAEAAVVVRGEAPNAALAAYVVAAPGAVPDLRALREDLAAELPPYMVPASITLLEDLPRMPNGKVDRTALASRPLREGERRGEEPRTETEQALARKWGEMLNVETLGVDDHFFELGGHSLLATQMVAWSRSVLGADLGLRALFERPTLGGFAAAVEASRGAATAAGTGAIVPVPRHGDLPLSFAQQRLWFVERLSPGGAFNMPLALRLTGRLDLAVLSRAFDEVVARHEPLRTLYPEVDGTPVQRIAPHRPVDLAVEDLRGLPEELRRPVLESRVVEEGRSPFDLALAPPVRARLFRLGEEEHAAILVLHHIASDAWSLGILVRELSELYRAFLLGEPSPLQPLPIGYADFAVWQRRWLTGAVLEKQLSYWRGRLGSLPPALKLPTDRPRPKIHTSRGGQIDFALQPEVIERLREISNRRGATFFMTLLAAFLVVLRHETGQDDLVVGTNVANRNRLETADLIGFFINQLVLRTGLAGAAGFLDVVDRVREVALEAYEHQDLPFEQLVEELQPDRDLSRPLLFEVKFELQNAPASELKLPGLVLCPLEVARGVVRYDLHLHLAEAGERVGGYLQYNSDLFDRATPAALLHLYLAVLARVAEQPEVSVAELLTELASLAREAETARRRSRQPGLGELLGARRARQEQGV